MTHRQPHDRQPAISLANWRTPARNQWAFHNVDKFIDTTRVENDPTNVARLARASASLGHARLRRAVLNAIRTDAIVILRDGKILFEWYAKGNDAHTPHILMSATKAVIGLLAGLLHDKGDIDLNAQVSIYVPEIETTSYRGATVRHLLDMQSEVDLNAEQLIAYDIATNWAPATLGEINADLASFMKTLTMPPRTHGVPFKYVSVNTDLLGWVIERATGRSVASALSELLWLPMGAEDPAYLTVDRKGLARCAGGLCATARDFARIGQLIVDNGRRGQHQIVPEAVIRDIVSGGDREAWKNGQWAKSFATISENMNYCSGWYLIKDEPQTMFAMGIHGQNLFIDRANKIVVAKLSSWKKPVDYVPLWITHKTYEGLRRSLLRTSV